MLIPEPGKITERITFLGRNECCVYAVDGGSEIAWIGGGMSYVIPDVLRQIEQFGIDEKKIKRMFILHSHHDHCGLIPYFKRRWPWAKVAASARAKKILSDPKIAANIADLNRASFAGTDLEGRAEELGYTFSEIPVEETVKEGDVIACGDLSLEVLEVPGHSSCSIAIYIPEEKALFGSDAAGVRHNKECFMACGNSDFNLFQQSLEKMARYDVNLVLGEHYGASTGEDAREYLPRSMAAARRLRAFMEASYQRTGNIKKSAEEVSEFILHEVPVSFLPRELMLVVGEQMVKCIAKDFSSEGTVYRK